MSIRANAELLRTLGGPGSGRHKGGGKQPSSEITKEMCQPGDPGDCFRNANKWNAKYGLKTDKVIHGQVTNVEGKTFAHAWIERGDKVVDPTTGAALSKDKYYELLKAKPESSYSSIEAVRNQIKAGHHGPWTKADLS